MRHAHSRPVLSTRLLVVIGLVLVGGGFAVVGLSQGRGPAAAATGPQKGPGTGFLHKDHSGMVAIPGQAGKTRELKCETCHAVSVEAPDTNRFPGPDLEKYPETAKLAATGTKLNGLGFPKSHSACVECHKEIAPGPGGKYCGLCHDTLQKLRVFPKANVQLSQFADRYSHKAHKDYYDNNPDTFKTAAVSRPAASHGIFGSATTFGTADILRVSYVAPPAEKGLRCSTCHIPATGGVKMQLPLHANCFECHANEKIVSKKADTYAMNCVGCHANMALNDPTVDEKLKPVKDALNAIAPVIDPFRVVITPSGAGHAQFNHVGGAAKYHEVLKPDAGKSAGKTIEGKMACLFCHTSVEKAATRAQVMAFAVKKTDPQLVQPPASACVVCHVHAVQMVVPDKPSKTGRAGCTVCHTAADAAKPAPATHSLGEAAPAATPAKPEATPPAAKPEPAKPTTAPAAKPEPAKPEPAKPAAPKPEPTKPATAPAAKPVETRKVETPKPAATPAPAKPETPKVEPPKPAPTEAPKTAPAPEPKPAEPAAPKPQAAPASGGTVDYSKGYPPTAPGSSHLSLPNPMLLGDPKTSDQWGLDGTWGISKLTHQDHSEKYKVSCATCHHTNGAGNAAIGEQVQRCVSCHKAEGDEKNPSSKDGDELWVKNAFHLGETGCIECHKRESAKNPNSKAATTCAGCHQPKGSADADRVLKGLFRDATTAVAFKVPGFADTWPRWQTRPAGFGLLGGQSLGGSFGGASVRALVCDVPARLWYAQFAGSGSHRSARVVSHARWQRHEPSHAARSRSPQVQLAPSWRGELPRLALAIALVDRNAGHGYRI
ncbi:MAG TPA: cytochrome c3 family protein [Blastocatellia bacterium]|nr:cytochrome c3 family protein [Blastocatellia bacterium]